jgi:Arf-GAP with SH3 domain, ANK repeat and PH domain-containing protein
MDPIDLRMASVREARNADRRFCFEVITPQFKRVYQATSEDDMNSWITSINNALQSAVEGRPFKEKPLATSTADSSFRRDIGSVLTGKSPSLSHGSGTSGSIPLRRTTVAGRPTAQRTASSGFEDSPDKLLQRLREHDQGNTWCADCGNTAKVEWVSINLAIILCIECSGIHRSLGTHISKIRSLTLDIKSFTPDIVELLLLVGNRVANMVWEAKMDPAQKLTAHATREQRLVFIKAKYEDRAFVEPISSTLSRYATADETLLAAIKRNEIQQVLYALALKANPNVTDKSRGTHSVYLALVAADPAAPGAVTPATEPTPDKRACFPVAELLLQNGAEIPAAMPAFPLSRSAQLYLETKRSRNMPATSHGPGSSSSTSTQDSVGSLPTGSSGGLLSSSGSEKLVNRDREAWLAKRASAGGRLAKSPIPER